MPKTLGYHLVKSCYGLWLPGDDRGSWSEAWDKRIGFVEPHTLHSGDSVRKRMAKERMAHAPVRMSATMIDAISLALGKCVVQSKGDFMVVAACIEPTHMHLLIPYSGRDIDKTAKWVADQTTKSIHRTTTHKGPVWCGGKWRSFIFDIKYWESARQYIEQHNIRCGRPAAPYPFIRPNA